MTEAQKAVATGEAGFSELGGFKAFDWVDGVNFFYDYVFERKEFRSVCTNLSMDAAEKTTDKGENRDDLTKLIDWFIDDEDEETFEYSGECAWVN